MLLRITGVVAGLLCACIAYRVSPGIMATGVITLIILVATPTLIFGCALLASVVWYGATEIHHTNAAGAILFVGLGAWATVAWRFGFLVCDRRAGIFAPNQLTRHAAGLRRLYLSSCILISATLLIRGMPVIEALCGAYVLFIIWRALAPIQPMPRTTLKAFAIDALLLTLCAAICFAGIEFVVYRYTNVNRGRAYMESDEQTYSTLARNASVIMYSPSTTGPPVPFSLQTSSQGLRDQEIAPKASNEFRIFMVGDSFTMGTGLAFPDTIPQQFQALLDRRGLSFRVRVINGGAAGYSPWQERIFLHERGMPLKPDLVILQLYPENDVPDTLARENRYLRAYNVPVARNAYVFRYHAFFPYRCEMFARAHSYTYRLFEMISYYRPLIADELLRLRILPEGMVPNLPPSLSRPWTLESSLREPYPELEEAYRLMEQDVSGIRQDCEEASVGIISFVIPNMDSVIDERWKGATAGTDAYQRYGDVLRTQALLEKHGIPFIDMVGPLREGRVGGEVYFTTDGHLNARGAGIVAATLDRRAPELYEPLKEIMVEGKNAAR